MWKKQLNLTEARALSYEFCSDFKLDYCEIYYVDKIGDAKGQYFYLDPPHILMTCNCLNKIGILMHELTHHLECQFYLKGDCYKSKETSHGYSYQLSKHKVVSWCRKNISKKPNWYIPLRAGYIKKDMINFKI